MIAKSILCLFAVLFSVMAFSMDSLNAKEAPNEFLKYDRLKQIDGSGDIKVRCYNQGSYWVCPNPFDKDRAKLHKSTYDQGFYFDYEDFSISKEEFLNNANWKT